MKEYLLDLTQDLIRIPSVSTDIEQLNRVVERVEQEFDEFKDHDWCIIERFEHNSKPSIVIKNFEWLWWDVCLNGHLDVVPVSEEGQFSPVVENEILYGRWAIDMKGSVATIIAVMKDVLQDGLDKKICLLLTSDEEVWWKDGAGYLAWLGYGWDALITPDATGIESIVTASKWLYNMYISVPGVSSHSAYPWRGKNAIEQAMFLYQELKDTLEDTHELQADDHRWTSVQMTMIESWTARNALPAEAKININIRHTESYSETLLKKLCSHVLNKFAATIIDESYSSLVYNEESHSVFTQYQLCAQEILWKDVVFRKTHGASDVRHLATWESVGLLHGPEWGNLHAEKEWVDIWSLVQLYEIIKKFVFTYK